jgi:hypothetical protein
MLLEPVDYLSQLVHPCAEDVVHVVSLSIYQQALVSASLLRAKDTDRHAGDTSAWRSAV